MSLPSATVIRSPQELASVTYRAQILSVLLLSFMVSSPLSSYLLGHVIQAYKPLAALVPGIGFSALIFFIGVWKSGLWDYRSETGSLKEAQRGDVDAAASMRVK